MARLRGLQIKDVKHMYEWMIDSEVTDNLILSRYPISEEKVIEFIKNSWSDKNNVHFAIVDEKGEYVGTVSLKNINYIDKNAEYAIALRKEFWGKNFALWATKEIINYGFKKLNLHKIYLNVLSSNHRANKFYEKMGFVKENVFKEHVYINGSYEDLIWYSVFNNR